MSIFRPTKRTPADRAPFRSVLAAIVVAGLATIGVTAFAAPAAAEESALIAVDSAALAAGDAVPEVTDPGDAEPGDAEPGDTEPGDTDSGDPAVAPPVTDATSPAGDSAAPEEQAVTPPGDAPQAATEEPAAAVFAAALLVPPGGDVVDKVEICHATAAHNNPYIINTPAADGDVSGHADHVGPIWFPGIEVTWGDIIPPFFYDDGDETPAFFPGLNWDAEGQLIFENDCNVPPPEPVVTATPGVCSVGDNGTATVDISGLIPGQTFEWTIEGPDGFVDGDVFTADATTASMSFDSLPPGDFTFTITWTEDEEVTDSVTFSVVPCQPQITAVVTECPAAGGEGSALLKLSSLVEGVTYDVWVTAQGDMNGTIFDGLKSATGDSTHMAEVQVSNLAAGKSYTAWVHGTWGDVALDASADFSLNPCPAVPITPAAVPITPVALAATGSDGVGAMLAGSMLLLGLGGAVLFAARRRETGVRELS